MINDKEDMFYSGNPKTEEQRLISELFKSLQEVMVVFINLNKKRVEQNELSKICLDASIAHAATVTKYLAKQLKVVDKHDLVNDVKATFNRYMARILDDGKN